MNWKRLIPCLSPLHNHQLNERMSVKETILVIYKKFDSFYCLSCWYRNAESHLTYTKKKTQNKQTKTKKQGWEENCIGYTRGRVCPSLCPDPANVWHAVDNFYALVPCYRKVVWFSLGGVREKQQNSQKFSITNFFF